MASRRKIMVLNRKIIIVSRSISILVFKRKMVFPKIGNNGFKSKKNMFFIGKFSNCHRENHGNQRNFTGQS